MDDEHPDPKRKSTRQRVGDYLVLILSFGATVLAVVWFVTKLDEPQADPMDTTAFRVVFYGFLVILTLAGLFASVRSILVDRRRA